MHVTETGPSCMGVIFLPLKPPSFTYACYRCKKTAFFEMLVAVETTLLAQVVLTLRSVFFERDGFALITIE